MAVNFDPVARSYRWLEYLSFGPLLGRCRNAQLGQLTGARRALVLGDGDGRFLARLLAVNPTLTADVVDSSRSMLDLLGKRVPASRVCLHHADALAWEPAGSYDLMVSHFFLDCFFPRQLEQLCDRVLPHALPGAQWVISEFAISANTWAAPLARGLIALLYKIFGVMTGLGVRSLPDHAAALSKRGLVLTHERRYLAGLLCSQLWRLPIEGAKQGLDERDPRLSRVQRNDLEFCMRFPWTFLLLSTVSAVAQVSAINAPDGKPLSQRVVAYWIDAKYDPATKTLEARETLEYRNPSDHPTTTLPFHLYLNAFQPESTFTRESHRDGNDIAYDKGEKGSIEVTAISTVAGADLTPSMRYLAPDDGNQNDHTVMAITLPKPLGPGEIIRLQLTFHDKFPLAIGRNGYKRDFIMGAQWFPKLGVLSHGAWNCHQYHEDTEFFADFGTYNVNLTLPQPYIVGASGIQTGEQVNFDGTKTLNFRGEDIHDFAWVASPHFQISDDTFENSLGTVRLHALVLPSHEDQAGRYLSVLKQSMQKFDEWYGPYPYKQITLIDPEPGSAVGGMEYPTLITAGTDWWAPSWDYYGLEATVAHEFGHQYWYGMVATNEFEEPWLDEGINSYSEAKSLASLYGQNTSAYNALTFYGSNARRRRMGYLGHPDQDPIVREGWKFANDESFVAIVYNKTATVLLTLEGILGETTVRRALRLYFTRYRFTHPTGADFLNTLQQAAAGANLQPFLAQAIYGTEVLDYSVDSLTSEANQTTVVVRRKGGFVLPVHVEVGFADGSKEQVTWDGKDRWARWTWDKPSPAVYAQVDRDDNILLDANSFNNSYVPQADRTARVKLTNYWIFTQQLLSQWLSFLV